jgi:hypothetical protein
MPLTDAEKTRRYREANPEKVREQNRRYREANQEARRRSAREQHERARNAVLDHYGRQCACCGATDRLVIDHTNGGGKQHRAEIGRGSTYRWLARNGFPEGFQTLCDPCNRSKFNTPACRIDHGRPGS